MWLQTLNRSQHFFIYEYYHKELRYAVSIAVMLSPQVYIDMKRLLTNAAPCFTKSVGGSLAIGYQFLSRDGLYLCRLYFHIPLGVWRIHVRNHGFPSAVSKEFNRHIFGDIFIHSPTPQKLLALGVVKLTQEIVHFHPLKVDLLLGNDNFLDKEEQ